MKKHLKSIVLSALAASMLASSAMAANFTSSADVLNSLGLFNGTANGYELDRAPDRAEAATMLVRLLGKEAEAKEFYATMTAATTETKTEETVPMTELTPAEETKTEEKQSQQFVVDAETLTALGLTMENNTLKVVDSAKLTAAAAAATEGVTDVDFLEGKDKMYWVALEVPAPEGAALVKFDIPDAELKGELSLTAAGESIMFWTSEDGKLYFNTGVAVRSTDGTWAPMASEVQATKNLSWYDADGKLLAETSGTLTFDDGSKDAAETEAPEAKPETPAEETEETAPAEPAEPYVFPFTDMDAYEWAKPYVAWLYDQGLTSGATATTYEPNGACTAQMYATFLLRALGYSDAEGGDFTYANAVEFAKEIGVVDDVNLMGDTFLRDNIASMSYTALYVSPKGSESPLLDKLVADGAVSAEAAAPVQQTFAALSSFNEAYAAVADETSMDAKATFTMKATAAEESVDTTGEFQVQVKVDPEDLAKMEMALVGNLKMTIMGTTVEVPMEMYIKDGVAYTNTMDQKIRQDMDLETALAGFDMNELMAVKDMPLTMVNSIAKDGDTYKLSYNTAVFNSFITKIFDSAMGSVEITPELAAQGVTADMFKVDMNLTKADVTVTMKNGALKSEAIDMAMTMDVAGVSMNMDMQMTIDVKATGDKVTVKFPNDLDTYKTMEELAAEAETAAETEASAESTDSSAETATDAPAAEPDAPASATETPATEAPAADAAA